MYIYLDRAFLTGVVDLGVFHKKAFELQKDLSSSSEQEVEEKDERNCDAYSSNVVNPFATAHAYFNFARSFAHHGAISHESFTFAASFLQKLPTLHSQLHVVHHDLLSLFQLLPQLPNFGPILRIVIPFGHKGICLGLELAIGCLDGRRLERLIYVVVLH